MEYLNVYLLLCFRFTLCLVENPSDYICFCGLRNFADLRNKKVRSFTYIFCQVMSFVYIFCQVMSANLSYIYSVVMSANLSYIYSMEHQYDFVDNQSYCLQRYCNCNITTKSGCKSSKTILRCFNSLTSKLHMYCLNFLNISLTI